MDEIPVLEGYYILDGMIVVHRDNLHEFEFQSAQSVLLHDDWGDEPDDGEKEPIPLRTVNE